MPLKVVPLSNELPGFAPLPEELVTGELALNTCDGVLYTKLSDGTITSVCCGGSSAPAAASALSVPEHYIGGGCGPCGPMDGSESDSVTTIDSVTCDFCIFSIRWSIHPTRCYVLPDGVQFQYSVDGGVTWVILFALPLSELGSEAEHTTQLLRPSDAVGLFSIRIVPIGHTGQVQEYVTDGGQCACDPPPPPPPTRFECVDGACGETSGTPDFVASWPTPGECEAHMTCDEDVQSWTCSGTTCTLTPGVAPDGITHFATSGACTTACVESWTCSGSTCTHTPGVAPDGFTHYATSLLCTAACETPDYLSYRCVSGNVQPSLVAPDNVTYWETERAARALCGVTHWAPHVAVCSRLGEYLDPSAGPDDPNRYVGLYGWGDISSPGSVCQFGDQNGGFDPLTHEQIFQNPWTGMAQHTTSPDGEVLYTFADGGYAGVSIIYPSLAWCGTCDAAHNNQQVSLPCTVYNAAP